MSLIFVDVESSGLEADTYPLQIAWYVNENENDCFYIKPLESWINNRPWSYDSQEVHNLPMQLLLDVGIDPHLACTRLNAALTGKVVYCDALAYDTRWIDVLFSDCDIKREFEIQHVYDAIPRQYVAILNYALKTAPENPHDALEDATLLAKTTHGVLSKIKKRKKK